MPSFRDDAGEYRFRFAQKKSCRIVRASGDKIYVKMNEHDLGLLARYARERDEDAFAEIVRRHINLVYSVALRHVGSPELAEEVAQSAFTNLARDARRLSPDTVLSAWLYTVAHRTALNVL